MFKLLITLTIVGWFGYFLGCNPKFRIKVIEIIKKFREFIKKMIKLVFEKIVKYLKNKFYKGNC